MKNTPFFLFVFSTLAAPFTRIAILGLSFIEIVFYDFYALIRLEAWTTLEEDYILTWGPVLKPV